MMKYKEWLCLHKNHTALDKALQEYRKVILGENIFRNALKSV